MAFLLKKYHLDNETLAKCTGVAAATIASLRSRPTNPTIATLQTLADYFNLTIDQLISQDLSLDIQEGINNKISLNIPIIDLSMVEQWPFDWQCNHKQINCVTTGSGVSNLCCAIALLTEVLLPYYQKNTR